MKTCQNCSKEYLEIDHACSTCKYPILGSDQDKASFIAQQEINRGHVIFSKRDLKIAKIVLALIGSYFAFTAYLVTRAYGFNAAFMFVILALTFGILFSQSSKAPQQTFFIGLCIMTLYYLLDLILAPELFLNGSLYKAFIIVALGLGYYRIKRANKILKENSYLASELGIKSM